MVGLRRSDVARASPSTGIGIQRELTHDKNLATGIGQRPVHHTVLVVDNAQVPQLVGKLAGVGERVVVGHSHEHAEPGTNSANNLGTVGAHNGDTRFKNSLDQCSHGAIVASEARTR